MVIRNQMTEKRLDLWKNLPVFPNLLLSGRKGSGKFSTVNELLSEIFGTEQPFALPYVHLIQPAEKGMITKDQIDGLIELADYMSTERRVFVLDDADTMSESAQNALLKLLEDKEDSCLFILVAHGPLIPTIASRCMAIYFAPLAMEEAENLIPDIDPVLWDGCDGAIGTYLSLRESGNFLKKAVSLQEAVFYGTRKSLLETCGLLKEKDRDVLTELLTADELVALFTGLKAAFARELVRETADQTICLDPYFTAKAAEYLQEAVVKIKNRQFHTSELFELMLFIGSRKDD